MPFDPHCPGLDPGFGRQARSRLPATLFRTADLPPVERFDAWRESVGVLFDVGLTRPEHAERFDARAESYLVEDIMLSRCAAGLQSFARSPLRVARDSLDHYMVQLFLDGGVEMNRHGRTLACAAGGLIGFDLADVLDSVNSDFDLVSVIIPRRRLAPLLPRPDSLQGQLVDPASGAGQMLAAFLRSLFVAAPSLAPVEAGGAARSLVELVAMSFNGAQLGPGDVPEAVEQAELLRAQVFIRGRLAAPELGPETIAAAMGLSRATLYRLFAPIGGVAAYIREQRLRRCLADLLSLRHAHLQIAEIGWRWGFADPAHFARAFKQRFGRTPSQAREAVAAAPSPRTDIDPRVGDRLHEVWLSSLA